MTRPSPLLLTLLTAGLLGLAACSVVETDLSKGGSQGFTPTVPTVLDGELAQLVEETLDFCDEGTLPLSFDEPDAVHAFVLTLYSGELLQISTSGDPGVDTVLMLHGPLDDLGDFGELPRAMNDDGDETLHASLDDFVVPQTGYWLVGVTTWGGASLGDIELFVSVDGADPVCEFLPGDDTLDWDEGWEDDWDDSWDDSWDDDWDLDVCCELQPGSWWIPADACDSLGGEIDDDGGDCEEDAGRGDLVCCTDGEHVFATGSFECESDEDKWQSSHDLETCELTDGSDSEGRDD